MKKLLAMALSLMLALGICPAMADGGEVPYERIVQMAQEVRELAFGDYLAFHGVAQSIQNRARNWALGIDETPDLVVRLDIDGSPVVQEYRASFVSEHERVSFEAQSNAMALVMIYSMMQAANESVTAEASYEENGEVNSALNASIIFADASLEEGTSLYVVCYSDAQPLFILSTVENGAAQMRAQFIPSRTLAQATSYVQVAMWFMRWGCPMTGEMVLPVQP